MSSLDLFPTLLASAGIKPALDLPGLDLRDRAALLARPSLQGACFTHNARDLNDPAANLRWRWILEDGSKLIVPSPNNEADAPLELFHLSADPQELNNLAPAEQARVGRLRTALDAWWNPQP